jgi:DtxR family Mn-dependent transcriptional regulator
MESSWFESRGNEERQKDELLELVWLLIENGGASARDLLDDPRAATQLEHPQEVMRRAIEDGLLRETGGHLELTDKGRNRAKGIIRRNRLTLRLFHDLLDLPRRAATAPACALEHELSPEATGAICTLLGHPRLDPEGRHIPRGPCCRSATRKVEPVVVPLAELGVGQDGRVCYMTTRFHERYERLSTFGIVPGAVFRLHQKSPSYVIETAGTTIAIDKEIASEIFVVHRGEGEA